MIFSRRYFEAKMPDSYGDPFISDLTLKGPLFTETTKTAETKSGQRKLGAKSPLLFFTFLT